MVDIIKIKPYSGHSFEIKSNKKFLGYIKVILENSSTVHVIQIKIDKEFRGKGLGKQLYLHAENEWKNKGIKQVLIEVVTPEAFAFWTKLGFKKYKPRDKLTPPKTRDIWMFKKLK